MRTLKSSMKDIFATIFCFLMNLVPGKKFFKKVNNGMNMGMFLAMVLNLNSGQSAYDKSTNGNSINNDVNAGSKIVNFVQNNRIEKDKYLSHYISYLYEYVDYLRINKKSMNAAYDKTSFSIYEDTG